MLFDLQGKQISASAPVSQQMIERMSPSLTAGLLEGLHHWQHQQIVTENIRFDISSWCTKFGHGEELLFAAQAAYPNGEHPEIAKIFFNELVEQKLMHADERFYRVSRPKLHQLNVYARTALPKHFWKRAA